MLYGEVPILIAYNDIVKDSTLQALIVDNKLPLISVKDSSRFVDNTNAKVDNGIKHKFAIYDEDKDTFVFSGGIYQIPPAIHNPIIIDIGINVHMSGDDSIMIYNIYRFNSIVIDNNVHISSHGNEIRRVSVMTANNNIKEYGIRFNIDIRKILESFNRDKKIILNLL